MADPPLTPSTLSRACLAVSNGEPNDVRPISEVKPGRLLCRNYWQFSAQHPPPHSLLTSSLDPNDTILPIFRRLKKNAIMSLPSRAVPHIRLACRAARITRSFTTAPHLRKQEEWPQRTPLGPYYETILNNPTPFPFDQKPEEPPNSADPKVLPEGKKPVETTTPESRPAKKKPGRPRKTTATASSTSETAFSTTSTEKTAQEKVRIVFGTRLAGPDDVAARMANKESKSTYIAGVRVPPQPQEPDNCCMSGCVNCVWELYREDMEEWQSKKAEAEARLNGVAGSDDAAAAAAVATKSKETWARPPSGVAMGDTKIAKDLWDDDIYQGVPVGIREFMKQEKRLKERHEREGTSGS